MSDKIELPKLPIGQRQPKGSDVVKYTLSLPAMTIEMLERIAKRKNKSVSAIANYYIWNGYHVDHGTYKPPSKPGSDRNLEG